MPRACVRRVLTPIVFGSVALQPPRQRAKSYRATHLLRLDRGSVSRLP